MVIRFSALFTFINILKGWHKINFYIFSSKNISFYSWDVILLSTDRNCLMKNQPRFVSSSIECDGLFCSACFLYIFFHIWLSEVWMWWARCDVLCIYPIWNSLNFCVFNLVFYLSPKLEKISFMISSNIILPHFSLLLF